MANQDGMAIVGGVRIPHPYRGSYDGQQPAGRGHEFHLMTAAAVIDRQDQA
ncbi:MAG TPA: hypothetical protein VKB62_13590 [Streptosporangiaceae bacterium]|nr:hypothetical protein [Streptosporangiaceae bacterium]